MTSLERSSSDRLAMLHALTEPLSDDDDTQVRAFLIGALSALCSDDVWAEALGTAMSLLDALENTRRR